MRFFASSIVGLWFLGMLACGGGGNKRAQREVQAVPTPTPVVVPVIPTVDISPPVPTIIVNIPTIAGRRQKQVDAILGKSSGCIKERMSRVAGEVLTCEYLNKQVSVTFIEGKADWIYVGGYKDSESILNVPYVPESLSYLGLKTGNKPVFGPMNMNWGHDGVAGYHNVWMGAPNIDREKITSALIKVKTD